MSLLETKVILFILDVKFIEIFYLSCFVLYSRYLPCFALFYIQDIYLILRCFIFKMFTLFCCYISITDDIFYFFAALMMYLTINTKDIGEKTMH